MLACSLHYIFFVMLLWILLIVYSFIFQEKMTDPEDKEMMKSLKEEVEQELREICEDVVVSVQSKKGFVCPCVCVCVCVCVRAWWVVL